MRKLALLAAIPLIAHDLYLMPAKFTATPGAMVPVAFHNGDSFPESEVPMTIARIQDAQLLGAAGASPVINLRQVGKATLGEAKAPSSGTLIFSAHTKPNFIELAPAKFEDYLKEEGLGYIIEWRKKNNQSNLPGKERYSKSVKSLILAGQPSDFYKHVVGNTLEIVPEADPYTLKPGAKLPVRVLLRGKPAPNLQMEVAIAPPTGAARVHAVGSTDANGRITIPLESAGKWRLHTLFMERCSDPKAADWESFWSSLTFELK